MTYYQTKSLIDRRLRLMQSLLKSHSPVKALQLQGINDQLEQAQITPKDSYNQDDTGKIISITGTVW